MIVIVRHPERTSAIDFAETSLPHICLMMYHHSGWRVGDHGALMASSSVGNQDAAASPTLLLSRPCYSGILDSIIFSKLFDIYEAAD